jgi:hypothetical protein
MPAAWTVKDREGRLLPDFVAGSRLEVGRKLVGNRYDAFRLLVSSSYREVFDRDLKGVLDRKNWQIVPFPPHRRRRSSVGAQLELKLH